MIVGSTIFGFTDIQAKSVFDFTPTQRVDVTLVAGQSQLDLRRDDDDPNLISASRSAAMDSTTTGGMVPRCPTEVVTPLRIAGA